MVYNTLKKRRILKHLETSSTMAEAGRKAKVSTKSGTLYRESTRKYIAEAIHSNPEAIKARFEHLSFKAEEAGDLTNANRATESLAKCNNQFSDGIKIDATIVSINQPVISKYLPTTPQDSKEVLPK